MSRETFYKQTSTPSTPASGRASLYLKTNKIWYFLDEDGIERPVGAAVAGIGGAIQSGAAVLNFGSGSGSNNATVTVTGQTLITSGSMILAAMMAEATAGSHNAYEHQMVPIKLSCGNVVAGVGFDIIGVTDWRLNGTFNVRWSWI